MKTVRTPEASVVNGLKTVINLAGTDGKSTGAEHGVVAWWGDRTLYRTGLGSGLVFGRFWVEVRQDRIFVFVLSTSGRLPTAP